MDNLVKTGAAVLIGALALAPHAQAQVFVTSITASWPDSNGKVPAFNVVPGAAIPTWSIGLAQAVLSHGQYYNYCISIGSATAAGKAAVSFKIARGATVIQSAVIIKAADFTVGSNGVWYYCSGYKLLPASAGAATLTGSVAYTASGATKPKISKLSVPILLQ